MPSSHPKWWETAVFLEIRVEAVQDSTSTGAGDFPGLRSRLSQLRDTGANALWITPFYPSPGDDDGYDISDTRSVDPRYGTIDDFRSFVEDSHRLGMKVVIDLVPCHTSDQHPEFQASRRDPDGPFGDHYVWHPRGDIFVSYRDEQGRKQEIRNMLQADPAPRMVRDRDGDLVAARNWTFDEVRGEYFYHPFKSSQPARNFANPAVREAVVQDFRFWALLGVDGIRIDAAPFLFQEEGTPCEELPRVHEFLTWLRGRLESDFPDLMLWCESNVPDVLSYFGGGFQCHAAFDFSTRIGLWLSHATRDARHFLDELTSRKALPDGCTMVQHLGCHDDERVLWRPDGDLELMRSHYGTGDRGRPYLDDAVVGSFSAKLDHDRAAMELMLVQLALLPGAKLVYYRDLLALSHHLDVIEQEDDLRRALRGPFPWSDGPTAGFSRAAPEQLYQPLTDDASSRNAHFAAQWDDPDSWLHFHRRVNTLVRRYPALTVGDFDVLDEMPAGSVWGCVRTDGKDSLIGVCNLGEADVHITSALPKHTRSQWRGAVLRDVLRGGRAGSVDQTGRLDLVVPAGGYVVAGRAS